MRSIVISAFLVTSTASLAMAQTSSATPGYRVTTIPAAPDAGLPPGASATGPNTVPVAPPPATGKTHAREGGLRDSQLAGRFHSANTTGDGHLTKAQAQAGNLGPIAKHFDEIDSGHKGYLTMDDVSTWRARKRLARAAQNQGPNGQPFTPARPPQ